MHEGKEHSIMSEVRTKKISGVRKIDEELISILAFQRTVLKSVPETNSNLANYQTGSTIKRIFRKNSNFENESLKFDFSRPLQAENLAL